LYLLEFLVIKTSRRPIKVRHFTLKEEGEMKVLKMFLIFQNIISKTPQLANARRR